MLGGGEREGEREEGEREGEGRKVEREGEEGGEGEGGKGGRGGKGGQEGGGGSRRGQHMYVRDKQTIPPSCAHTCTCRA